MNRGQADAKKKRPRRSTPKRGAFKLTPKRIRALRGIAQNTVYGKLTGAEEEETPPCPI